MAKRKIAFIGATSIEPYFAGLIYDFFADIEDFTVSPTRAEFLQMYYGEDTSCPSFTVSYKGATFQLKRGVKIGNSCSGYLGQTVSPASLSGRGVSISYSGYSVVNEAERAINLEVVYGENLLLIRAGNYNSARANSLEWLWLFDTDGTSLIFCETNSITTGNFSSVDFQTDTNSIAYCIAPICSYTTSNNNIDIYDYIIMKRKTGKVKVAVFHVDELKSCSPVPANTLLTIENKKYLSIGTHLLVEIEEANNHDV